MDPVGLHRKGEIQLDEVLEYFSRLPDYHKAGAIACFIGVVREDPVRGSAGKVTHLEYEAHRGLALKQMEEIRQEIMNRPGIVAVSIHHIIDHLGLGEPSLFVAVLGKHRQEVFPALAETVELVKQRVFIWKKEHTASDSYWVPAIEPGPS